jgi:hypothetical protein
MGCSVLINSQDLATDFNQGEVSINDRFVTNTAHTSFDLLTM